MFSVDCPYCQASNEVCLEEENFSVESCWHCDKSFFVEVLAPFTLRVSALSEKERQDLCEHEPKLLYTTTGSTKKFICEKCQLTWNEKCEDKVEECGNAQ